MLFKFYYCFIKSSSTYCILSQCSLAKKQMGQKTLTLSPASLISSLSLFLVFSLPDLSLFDFFIVVVENHSLRPLVTTPSTRLHQMIQGSTTRNATLSPSMLLNHHTRRHLSSPIASSEQHPTSPLLSIDSEDDGESNTEAPSRSEAEKQLYTREALQGCRPRLPDLRTNSIG